MSMKGDETLEDLQIGGLFLLQKRTGFRFGTDAVLLSDFAKTAPSQRTLDLCTGSGIVPLLLAAKTATPRIDGLEIQHEYADMAARSVQYNHLEERVHIACGDLRNPPYGKASFDVITCNPPYIKNGGAVKSNADSKLIARHEIACTLDDVVRTGALLLKPGGQLFLVHRPQRLVDVLCSMRTYGIEPKTLRFVVPMQDKPPMLVLIGGRLGGGAELKALPALVMKNKDGSDTQEVHQIYGRRL